ncbi:DUF1015 domain-containing protein [Thiohalocapsa marina]|uniref:DUF1015 domain-containing protein n=1 Tax=Thiohalocapsa marina TaxID=424902 RepID=A0A5M8FLA3_9GAMM|nr:DUF1015 family protein [Thiohalocapsa marina]KAA6184546.1 DUF1015 domain-containing protein [Thiohalocapsa marina]
MTHPRSLSPPLIAPFCGLRPTPDIAGAVIAPHYDVMDTVEARAFAKERPWSFLHLSRAGIDLPAGTNPHAAQAYAQAAAQFLHMRAVGVLRADPAPCYYVYRATRGAQVQTGLVLAASVEAYQEGRIRRHELTLAAKEDDRVRQIEALDAQTAPAFLLHRRSPAIDDLLAQITEHPPALQAEAPDAVRDPKRDQHGDRVQHQLWVVDQPEQIAQLTAAFEAQPRLYIADGHHRTAAAARIADGRAQAALGNRSAHGHWKRFLAVSFPADALQILAVHRLVRDLNGLNPTTFLRRIAERFDVTPSETAVLPEAPGLFGLYLDQRWYRLRLHAGRIPHRGSQADPVARLDVRLLQDQLLQPVLGIEDPRQDPRLDFVGGIRGLEGLIRPVDQGRMRAAFALHPASLEDLMAVADAGLTMPPKCTWFETKLVDGLVSLPLDLAITRDMPDADTWHAPSPARHPMDAISMSGPA